MLYCGIAAFIACFFLFGEPFLKGHFLGTWLLYGTTSPRNDWFNRYNFTPSTEDIETAIRRIGPRAIPVLLEKLDTTDAAWKRSFANWQSRTEWLPDWTKIRFKWAEEEHAQAIFGFSVLRTQAVSAIPALSQRLGMTNAPYAAAICLIKIDSASSLPVLRMALTNGQPAVRNAALSALETDPSLLQQTLPEMRLLTSDSEERNAAAAFYYLSFYGPPDEATAYLRQALRDSRAPVMNLALANVNHMGTNARPFIPELSNLLTHPRISFRRNATNILKRIDPAAAFAAGVNTNPPAPNTNSNRGGRRGPPPPSPL
jgi:HEAT repeat protein